jgi:hypothetical protein
LKLISSIGELEISSIGELEISSMGELEISSMGELETDFEHISRLETRQGLGPCAMDGI